jgi:hypothetical protein
MMNFSLTAGKAATRLTYSSRTSWTNRKWILIGNPRCPYCENRTEVSVDDKTICIAEVGFRKLDI